MSNQNFAFGLPSKPRSAEPCMFSILSMDGRCPINQSVCDQQIKNTNEINKCIQSCCVQQQIQFASVPKVIEIVPQNCTQQNKSTFIQNNYCQQNHVIYDNDKMNQLKKSTVFPKQIKHELYSYQRSNLKQSRAKSAVLKLVPQIEQIVTKKTQKQQILDQKTIKQRKKKIKQFQIFTRQLPNSSFITYYGKPAFQAYGRNASCSNLKTSNIMPHKGQNHPKNLQTHYTALMKGRQIKSKSYMPRKPIDQPIIPAIHSNKEEIEVNFPLQKPDLVKLTRFSKANYSHGKKQGIPPQNIPNDKTTKPIKPKNNLTVNPNSNKKNKKKKTKTQTTFLNDGLKFMNKRQNLIALIEQKKLKASQLAFKVTECYPLEWNCSQVCSRYVQNNEQSRPAGKKRQDGDHMQDIFQGKKILQQSNIHIVKK